MGEFETKKIWEVVKDLEENKATAERICGEINATMIENFGPDGKCRPGLIDGSESALGKLIKAFEFYEKTVRDQNELLVDIFNCGDTTLLNGHWDRLKKIIQQ